jgi:signal transduction histidine kinase/streptogramin lyase
MYSYDNERFDDFVRYDELSGISITCITQDESGFMWFGTNNGLNRYDGSQLQVYKNDPVYYSSLTNNHITSLYTTNQNKLWIGTKKGLNIYDPQDHSFSVFFHMPDNPFSISDEHITTIIQDESNTFWIGTVNGLNRYSAKDQSFVSYYTNPHKENVLSNNYINVLFVDSNGVLWVGTQNGLNKTIKTGHKISFKQYLFNKKSKNCITSIVQDNNDRFLVGIKNKGLYHFDKQNGTSKPVKLNNHWHKYFDRINTISKTNNDKYWIGTDMGLFVLDDLKKEIIRIAPQYSKKGGFKGDIIKSIFETDQGCLWVGTEHFGLNIIFPERDKIQKTCFNRHEDLSVSCKNIQSFYLFENALWIGMNHGYVDRWDMKNNRFTHYHWPELNNITALNKDKQFLWVGSSEGFGRLDIKTQKFKKFKYPSNGTGDNTIIDIFTLDSGKIWLGTQNGLVMFDQETENIVPYIPVKTTIYDNPEWNEINSISIGKNGVFWLTSKMYVYQFHLKNKSYDRHFIKKINLRDTEINNAILIDDMLWIGTENGLYKFNIHTKLCNEVLAGVLSERINVQSLLPDDHGNIWLGTHDAIIKYNIKHDSSIVYDSWYYFNNVGYNRNAAAITEDEKIIFGGATGLNVFDSSDLTLNRKTVKLHFTGFDLLNKSGNKKYAYVLQDHSSFSDKITLKHDQNSFRVSFALTDYRKCRDIIYAYKMDGVNEQWKYLKSNHIDFNYLTYGEYRLKLKARDFNGIWHNAPVVEIEILKPFWLTLAFKAVLSLSIIIILLLIIGRWGRKNKRIIGRLKKILEDKTVKFEENNKDLQKQNKTLRFQEEQLKAQKEDLLSQNEELRMQEDELEKQKEELSKMNATKDKLFSIIGHDLKNPFYAISNFGRLLVRNFSKYSDEQKTKMIGMMKGASENANELLENILQWSRLNTNRIEYYPEKVNIKSLINENIRLFTLAATNKNIDLVTEDLELYAYIDREMINTVIRNLLSNAIKFTNPGGRIELATVELKDYIKIEIKDNGLGMDEYTRKKLFDVQKHTSRTGTQGESGTGIGLLLCKEFVEKNYGLIDVKSEMGKGSIFILKVPKYKK